MQVHRLIVALILLPLATAGFAQRPINQHPVKVPEEQEKPAWVEETIEPPAFPQDADLIPLEMAASSNKHFVDGKTVNIGNDGVIRYAMVIRSSGGATNVSYEGIRCETRERKLFALGRSDGTWSPARAPKWVAINETGTRTYQAVLMKDIFCPQDIAVKSLEEARSALRAGYNPRLRSQSKR